MKILDWNCQGICNDSTIRALKAQIKGTRLDILFLSETKAKVGHMEYVKSSLKFDHFVVVEAKGKAGGLCMLWKDGILASQVEFEENLIAVKISDAFCDWLFVGFYGPPYYSKKKKAWESLTGLLKSFQGLQVYIPMGDFNYTLNEDEKKGGRRGSTLETNHLKDLMFEFRAINLGYSGSKFTWAKGNWDNTAIKRRLDRGIAITLGDLLI